MGDLKPIGSEKLQGQDKLRRIMEIARFNETIPTTINETSRTEFNRTLSDGNNYEIVKERQGYIIKKTISESETDYIEPMKNRKYYSSYSQALKRLNLVAGELNRVNENEEGTSMFGEQKKFTLKTPKPKAADVPVEAAAPPMAPPPVPAPELPASPIGGEEMDLGMDSEEMAPEGDIDMDVDASMEVGGSDETVTFKSIQKLTGKLTQKIRTLESQEGMTSEDIKYVINMVLSSFDLNELSEEDREDILSKFEDETEDLGGDDMGGEDLTDDSEVEDIQADMDIPMEGEMDEQDFEDDFEDEDDNEEFDWTMGKKDDPNQLKLPPKRIRINTNEKDSDYGNGAIIDSIFGESKVDKVISKYFEVSKKEIVEGRERVAKKKLGRIADVKKQMGEVIKLSETIEQELSSQKFLNENFSAKIIGKTNKQNLVFENKGKQVKITPEGQIL
jgi:hypothetical protein